MSRGPKWSWGEHRSQRSVHRRGAGGSWRGPSNSGSAYQRWMVACAPSQRPPGPAPKNGSAVAVSWAVGSAVAGARGQAAAGVDGADALRHLVGREGAVLVVEAVGGAVGRGVTSNFTRWMCWPRMSVGVRTWKSSSS